MSTTLVHRIALLLALLLLSSCAPSLEGFNPADPTHDSDADGQTEDEGDCDDLDAANFDGNPEICDGQDNDCNGLDDMGLAGTEGQETDDDGDGQTDCQGDCDDSDAANFTGNAEICDGQDNDCNELDDMGLPGTTDEETDNDGDGQTECQGDCASLFKPAVLAVADGGSILATNHVPSVPLDSWIDGLKRTADKAGRSLKQIDVLEPEADFPSFDGQPPLKIAICSV